MSWLDPLRSDRPLRTDGMSSRLPYNSHLKWIALYDSQNEFRETIIMARRLLNHGTNRGHVIISRRSSQRVGEKLLGRGGNKHIGAAQKRFAERCRTVQLGAIDELARGVDRRLSLHGSPLP